MFYFIENIKLIFYKQLSASHISPFKVHVLFNEVKIIGKVNDAILFIKTRSMCFLMMFQCEE